MNATELTTLSMSELRAICSNHNIEVTGDKRLKATYILSIEISFQSQQTVTDTDIETSDPFEVDQPIYLMEAAVMAECHSTILDLYIDSAVTASTSPLAESIVQPPAPQQPTLTPQQQPTTHYRGASIVLIIPLVLLLVTIGAIGTLVPTIGTLMRFMGTLMKLTDTDCGTDRNNEPIDCPLVAA